MYKKRNCLYCGKEHNNEKFCSISCSRIYTWRLPKSPYKTKKYLRKLSKEKKEWYKHHQHPKGMLGKKQSSKCIRLSSERCKERIKDKHPNWKGGSQVYWNKIAVKVMKDIPNICWYGKRFNKQDKCEGEILVHHKDKDITNNKKINLVKVCKHHHLSYYHKKDCKNKINVMNKARLKKIKENPKWWKEVRNKIRRARENKNDNEKAK